MKITGWENVHTHSPETTKSTTDHADDDNAFPFYNMFAQNMLTPGHASTTPHSQQNPSSSESLSQSFVPERSEGSTRLRSVEKTPIDKVAVITEQTKAHLRSEAMRHDAVIKQASTSIDTLMVEINKKKHDILRSQGALIELKSLEEKLGSLVV